MKDTGQTESEPPDAETQIDYGLRVAFEPAAQTMPHRVLLQGWAALNQRREHGLIASDGNVAYKMVLIDNAALNSGLLGKMLALQVKAAKHPAPHPANPIDYKSAAEIANHYRNGGLGLALLTDDGALIGQTLLTVTAAQGPFCDDGSAAQLNVDWVMVDPAYGGNMLCDILLRKAHDLADELGLSQLRAVVRLHNEKGMTKFAAAGFVAAGTGSNVKDGSLNLQFFRAAGKTFAEHRELVGPETGDRVHTLAGLHDETRRQMFADLLSSGLVGVWSARARWFTLHSPATPLQTPEFRP